MQKMWKRMGLYTICVFSILFPYNILLRTLQIVRCIYMYIMCGCVQKSVTNFLVGGPRLKPNKHTERDVQASEIYGCRHGSLTLTRSWYCELCANAVKSAMIVIMVAYTYLPTYLYTEFANIVIRVEQIIYAKGQSVFELRDE